MLKRKARRGLKLKKGAGDKQQNESKIGNSTQNNSN